MKEFSSLPHTWCLISLMTLIHLFLHHSFIHSFMSKRLWRVISFFSPFQIYIYVCVCKRMVFFGTHLTQKITSNWVTVVIVDVRITLLFILSIRRKKPFFSHFSLSLFSTRSHSMFSINQSIISIVTEDEDEEEEQQQKQKTTRGRKVMPSSIERFLLTFQIAFSQ